MENQALEYIMSSKQIFYGFFIPDYPKQKKQKCISLFIVSYYKDVCVPTLFFFSTRILCCSQTPVLKRAVEMYQNEKGHLRNMGDRVEGENGWGKK